MDIPWLDRQMPHHPLTMLCLLITGAGLGPSALLGRPSLQNCIQMSFPGSFLFQMPPTYSMAPSPPSPQLGRFSQIKNLIHSFSPPPGVPESRGNDALSNVQVQLCIWKEILTSFRKKRPQMTLSSWREMLSCKC